MSPHHEHHDHHVDLVIVVSGQPQRLDVKPGQKLHHVVKEALELTGNAGQAPSKWALRREDGTLLDQQLPVRDAGLVDGTMLYLNPHAGAGGC